MRAVSVVVEWPGAYAASASPLEAGDIGPKGSRALAAILRSPYGVHAASSDEVTLTNFNYQTQPVDELEDVRGVFYGGRGQVGAQFVVTNRRLLLGPLDTRVAVAIDKYILNTISSGVGTVIGEVLASYGPMSARTIWLRHVRDVQPTNNASLFKAPGLRITTDTDESISLGIVQTTTTPNLSSANNAVRDQAVQVIRTAVAAAKTAAPPSAP